ncbi:hypothetical protein SAMN05660845_1344 [Flavobacterium swingsii]|uniref:Uncharacterized protein n=1 Tax=Flavobacterium swingsii TaxID=498292 RepID=A0A1I0XM55_9FLAO|nr:hypothetical protein [Flavobacterium swingsii]SFB01984.1 hypothetical protein SAMN05660845_1344 [Flavobacterium swingsii]
MKIYNSISYRRFIFFVIFSLYLIFFFKYNFKYTGYVFIGWVFSLIGIFSLYFEKELSMIMLDTEKEKIFIVYTSRFGREKEISEFLIDDVDCLITKEPGGRGGLKFVFEIKVNDEKLTKFFISGSGFSLDELRDLIKEISKLKE